MAVLGEGRVSPGRQQTEGFSWDTISLAGSPTRNVFHEQMDFWEALDTLPLWENP
jgi:hypothetical protein